MNFRKLTIPNRQGVELAARMDLPGEEEPVAYVIFAHCFTCSKNLKAAGNISRALTRAGMAVLRFDFTGLGESEGDFSESNFTTQVSDLLDAARFLTDAYEPPQILVGHSLGGAAVLQAASEIPSVRAVAVIAAPRDAAHVLSHLTEARHEIEARGEAWVQLGGRPFRIKKQLIDDLESHQMGRTIAGLNRSLLILHSPFDPVVGINNAADIFMAAKHPKSFVSLDKADHLLSDAADSQYAGTIISVWAERYISS